MGVKIIEVNDRRGLKRFVRFPFKLYKNHDYWVPPIIRNEMETLDPDKNPAHKHCEWIYFLAYKNGEIAGRIAGIINKAHNEAKNLKHVRYCWFDFIDDKEVSSALMGAVIEWAKSRGMKKIIGPMGFTTFERQGVVCEGYNHTPTFSAAYNYEYYPGHYEAMGFSKDIDYVEYEIKVPDEIPEKVIKISELIKQRYGLKLLNVSTTKEFLPYAPSVLEILNLAYEPLYGFVKLNHDQIEFFTRRFFSFIDVEFIEVILDKDDNMIGFQFTVRNLSKAMQKARGRLFPFGFLYIKRAMKTSKTLDLMLVGIHPDYQNKGINALFMLELQKTCNRYGILLAESNGEMEENEKVQSFWKHYDAKQYKRNRIFCKDLN